jgi:hypothetical protein
MTGCTPCDLGLDHCHAPILEHPDGTFECIEGCGGPRAIHDDVIDEAATLPPRRRSPARLGRAA